MNAALITIGDEILSGTTVDTNSNFIAGELRYIGIKVVQIFTISDDISAIKENLARAFQVADLVITTGGLGPTKDDRTKTAFKEFFNDELYEDPETFEHLKNLLTKRKREHLLEINRGQAEILRKAKVFQNENGTAPCQMIEENGKTVISLPGVPYEVKPLIKDKIIPYLQQKFHLNHILTQTVSVVDYPESLLSEALEPWELALPENFSLSYLPVGNRIKLKLTTSGESREILEQQMAEQIALLKPFVEEKTISWQGVDIQEIVGDLLRKKQLKISVAESCSGGELMHLLTSVAGSSDYFEGGLVTYSEHQKTKILGVSAEIIEQKTVVSEDVASAMAAGVQRLFGTDVALATTGVSGPGSDRFGTPVGTVFYTIKLRESEKTNRLFLPHMERKDFMNFVSQRVLQDLAELLTKNA